MIQNLAKNNLLRKRMRVTIRLRADTRYGHLLMPVVHWLNVAKLGQAIGVANLKVWKKQMKKLLKNGQKSTRKV